MAVVRTFDPRVDLAGAYLGGQRIKLGREQLAQEAASDAARIQLGREQLQQEAIANEMQLAAKKDLLSREALQKAQEAEIEKSYKETQFGLARRRLEDDERNTMMKVEEAARGLQAEQDYQRRVAGGESPDAAMRAVGFGRAGFGPAIEKLQVGAPRETASDRNLKYKMLQASKDDAAIKFGIRTPAYAAAIKDIDAKMEGLFQNQQQAPALSAPSGVVAAPAPPVFQGPLPPPQMFMGTPQGFDAGGFPSGQPTQFNVPPPAAAAPRVPAANEVLKTLKDGRKAIFDINTKKFIRYAD